jgi:hypothetical protein
VAIESSTPEPTTTPTPCPPPFAGDKRKKLISEVILAEEALKETVQEKGKSTA